MLPGPLAHARSWLPRGGALPAEVWDRRHRGILVLAWLHTPVILGLMVLRSDVDAGMLGVWALSVLMATGGTWTSSTRFRASCVTLSLLISTALLIHVFHGLIEMHFHFFVVIAVVAMYQLWTPYLIALAFVVAEHALMGLTMPMAVYNHAAAMHHPVTFAIIHGAFVLGESVACLTFWKLNESALDAERHERLRAEEMGESLARVNREMSDLLAMLSHDLRTPVALVTNYAEMAVDGWDELDQETLRGFVAQMGAAGQSLDRVLNDTLAMAADDAAALHSQPAPVRVDAAVQLVVPAQVGDPSAVDLTGLAPTTAMVDEGQLHQILTNLLSNAAKYGAPPYAVSTTERGSQVEIRVTDSGPGVAPDFVPRLFDRYARSDDARLGGKQGTGLGLYIVRQLVEANHGTVRYVDAPGGGACFVVELTRAAEAARPPQQRQSQLSAG